MNTNVPDRSEHPVYEQEYIICKFVKLYKNNTDFIEIFYHWLINEHSKKWTEMKKFFDGAMFDFGIRINMWCANCGMYISMGKIQG